MVSFTGSTAPSTLASDFQFHDHFTDGRNPRTSDQFVVRPLPKHRINTESLSYTSHPYDFSIQDSN
jgi:hypothetical protein